MERRPLGRHRLGERECQHARRVRSPIPSGKSPLRLASLRTSPQGEETGPRYFPHPSGGRREETEQRRPLGRHDFGERECQHARRAGEGKTEDELRPSIA